jgi:hypothetical protein
MQSENSSEDVEKKAESVESAEVRTDLNCIFLFRSHIDAPSLIRRQEDVDISSPVFLTRKVLSPGYRGRCILTQHFFLFNIRLKELINIHNDCSKGRPNLYTS